MNPLTMYWRNITTAPSEAWVLVFYPDGMGVSIALKNKDSGVWQDWDGDIYSEPTYWMKLPDGPEEYE